MFIWTGSTVPLPYSWWRSTRYSDRLYHFSVTIPRCYRDIYVNSFFPCTATLWNSLTIECFPLTYDLHDFKSRIKRDLLTEGFFRKRFLVYLNLSMFLFLVTPCRVMAIQPFIEWNPIKKAKKNSFATISIKRLRKAIASYMPRRGSINSKSFGKTANLF